MAKTILFVYHSYPHAKEGLRKFAEQGARIHHSAMTADFSNGDRYILKVLSHPNDYDKLKGLKYHNYRLEGGFDQQALALIRAGVRPNV